MKSNFIALLILLALSSCATYENKREETPRIAPKVIANKNFGKKLDFNPSLLKSVDIEDIKVLKRNYIQAYGRALKFTSQADNGVVTLNANKDSLKVSQELFNMIKLVIDDYNVFITKIKKEEGSANFTISPFNKIRVSDLDKISINELKDLYVRANK